MMYFLLLGLKKELLISRLSWIRVHFKYFTFIQRSGAVNNSVALLVWDSRQAKATELLRPFCFTIEKRHPSKYSPAVAKKGERGKENNACL